MKTKEELNALKEEAESKQHRELRDEELAQVSGGSGTAPVLKAGKAQKDTIK